MKIIEEELGSLVETFFSHIFEEAVVGTSFGQVYRTVDGRDVAVKVQRPNLRHLDIFQQVTKRKSNLRLYADELGKGLVGELDYTLEAANAVKFMQEVILTLHYCCHVSTKHHFSLAGKYKPFM
nr:protein kinase superfamily protein [Tanacetum cinerariifolium]